MACKLEADISALIGEHANEFEYCSFHDNLDTQTQLTIASMLKDKDKNNLVKICIFLCGMGSFLTFMITAAAPDYIEIVYPSHPDLLYLLVSVYNTANMIGLIIMLSPAGTYISIAVRIQYGYILTSLFTFFIPFIPYLFESQQFQVIMFLFVNGVMSGLSSALLVTSLFSFAAMLPNDYLITAVSGQSVAGILSAIIRIINKACFDTNTYGTTLSGIGCFTMAAMVQLVAAIIFAIAWNSQLVDEYMFQYWALRYSKYLDKDSSNKYDTDKPIINNYRNHHNYEYASHLHGDFVNPAATTDSTIATTSTNGTNTTNAISATSANSTVACSTIDDTEIEMSIKTVTTTHTVSEIEITSDLHHKNTNPTTEQSIERHFTLSKKKSWIMKRNQNKNINYSIVINKIYKCLLSIFIGYGATYLVFPSMIVGLQLNNKYLMRTKWSGVVLYLIWSIFGWLGIFAAKFKMFYCGTKYNNLWILQFVWMCTMYILFIIANEKIITTDLNDAYIYAIVSISPLLFGFLSARTFAELPPRIDTYETEIAQGITQLTLLTGILIGAWIAFGMNILL